MSKDGKVESVEQLKKLLKVEEGYSRCCIVNEVAGTFDYHYLKNDIIPKDSIPAYEDNILTHYISANGKLEFINYIDHNYEDKEEEEFRSPGDCFEAQYWEELDVVAGLKNPLIEKIKLGVFIALAISFTVVLLMVALTAMG